MLLGRRRHLEFGGQGLRCGPGCAMISVVCGKDSPIQSQGLFHFSVSLCKRISGGVLVRLLLTHCFRRNQTNLTGLCGIAKRIAMRVTMNCSLSLRAAATMAVPFDQNTTD